MNTVNIASDLSPRQRDILALICEEWPFKSMGKKLGVANKTVEYHSRVLKLKTGIDNNVGLYKLAVRLGMVPCPCGRNQDQFPK